MFAVEYHLLLTQDPGLIRTKIYRVEHTIEQLGRGATCHKRPQLNLFRILLFANHQRRHQVHQLLGLSFVTRVFQSFLIEQNAVFAHGIGYEHDVRRRIQ